MRGRPASAQRGTDTARMVAQWKSAPMDPAQLSQLIATTNTVGGVSILRTVLDLLGDPGTAPVVRVAALAAIDTYMDPGNYCRVRAMDSTQWNAGTYCGVDHPIYAASSSIEPIIRDTIMARVRKVATGSGWVARVADDFGGRWEAYERTNQYIREQCLRAQNELIPFAFGVATGFPSKPLADLAACPDAGPPVVAGAWRAARDSTIALQVLEVTGRIADRRIADAAFEVARDETRAPSVRIMAIDGIARVLHPAFDQYRSAKARENASHPCTVWGWATHEDIQVGGGEPLRNDTRAEVQARLASLARTTKPASVADAAKFTADCAQRFLHERPLQAWPITGASSSERTSLRYPSMLLSARVEGDVILDLAADSAGQIDRRTMRVVSSTHNLFTSAVRGALAGRSNPIVSDDQPFLGTRRDTVAFRLLRDTSQACGVRREHWIPVCAVARDERHISIP